MPAVRKPDVILEAAGSWKKDPARRRVNTPSTGRGVGPAPEGLAEDEVAAWDQIVADCAPGVWQSSDRGFLEQLARMLARSRRNPDGFGTKSMTLFVGMLARAGMTPADRSKVFVSREQDEKPKSGLASFR